MNEKAIQDRDTRIFGTSTANGFALSPEDIQTEWTERVKRVEKVIEQRQADAAIITSSVNQFYLCGRIFDGYLYIAQEKAPLLFVKRPETMDGTNIHKIRKPEQIPDLLRIINRSLPKKLLIESDQLSYNAVVRIQSALGNPLLLDISANMRTIRSVKSDYELRQMKESAAIHSAVYRMIPSLFREGMTDHELQIKIEREMRLHGSMGIFRAYGDKMDIFMGSLLAGNNAAIPSPFDYALGGAGTSPMLPLGANGTVLAPGMTVMVDMAGNYRPWMDDMTRTFAVKETPDIAWKAHQVSIDIHDAIVKTFHAGASCADLYVLAEEMVRQNGLEPYFMGTAQQAKFIGHGVGLEINEPPVLTPRSKETLETGMAIAIEPKFVLPDIGPVGIENTYVVGEEGLEKITFCEESLLLL